MPKDAPVGATWTVHKEIDEKYLLLFALRKNEQGEIEKEHILFEKCRHGISPQNIYDLFVTYDGNYVYYLDPVKDESEQILTCGNVAGGVVKEISYNNNQTNIKIESPIINQDGSLSKYTSTNIDVGQPLVSSGQHVTFGQKIANKISYSSPYIPSAIDGIVSSLTETDGHGSHIRISQNNGLFVEYFDCGEPAVSKGEEVTIGQKIADALTEKESSEISSYGLVYMYNDISLNPEKIIKNLYSQIEEN